MIISTGLKHQTGEVKSSEVSWPKFLDRCARTKRTPETFDEYLNFKKKRQSDIKSQAGYFIGGQSIDGSRKRDSIVNRSLLTLDIDHGVKGMAEMIEDVYGDFEYCIYSTHKHSDELPRLRLVIPLAEPIASEDYESLARQVAEDLGMDYFDDTTYQHSRIMFWPTTAKDGDWVSIHNKGDFLESEEYAPFDTWPKSSRELDKPNMRGVKQVEDPREKNGMIGAFCREYSIPEVIDEFLSHIYEETTSPDRYSFVGGSTTGGAVVYDDECILFSQHESDPAHGFSMNAFDLVRVHLVGEDAEISEMYAWIADYAGHITDNMLEDEFDELDDDDEDEEPTDGEKLSKVDKLLNSINEMMDSEDINSVIKKIAYAKVSKMDMTKVENRLVKRTKELDEPFSKREIRDSISELQSLQTTGEDNVVPLTDKQQVHFAQYVMIGGSGKITNTTNMVEVAKDTFNTKYKVNLDVGDPVAQLVGQDVIKCCDLIKSSPAKKKFYVEDHIKYLNSFRPVLTKSKPGDVTPLLNHIAYLLDDEYEQGILLDFIAYNVQFPSRKIRWMPIIKGGKGIGKTFIADHIIRNVLGRRNVNAVEAQNVFNDEKAQGWKISHSFVVFNELDCGNDANKRKFTDMLKTFITDDYLSVRDLFVPKRDYENLTNVLGFTNEEDSLIITEDERRYCMMESYAVKKPYEYYQELRGWIELHIPQMLHFFRTRDLSAFKPDEVPETEYTRAIKESSKPWIRTVLEDGIEEASYPFNTDALTFGSIESYVSNHAPSYSSDWELKKLTAELKQMGFVAFSHPDSKSKRVRIDGHLQSLWILPGVNVRKLYKQDKKDIIKLITDSAPKDFDD